MGNVRVSTGVPGFDEVLNRGFRRHFSHLLVGNGGTGKVILSLHWMLDATRRRDRGLLITLAEPRDKLEENIAGLAGGPMPLTSSISRQWMEPTGGMRHVLPPSEVENAWISKEVT